MSSTARPFTLVYLNDPVDDDSDSVEQMFFFENAAKAEDWSNDVTAIKTVHEYFGYCLEERSEGYCKAVAKDYIRMTYHFGLKWEFEVPQDVMRQYQGVVAWLRAH